MAHGLNTTVKRGTNSLVCKSEGKAGIGSRRIFAPQFKLQVLDSYRNDVDCKGNQRATARKYGIHRRQIQKWLQVENNLRNSVIKSKSGELTASPEARKCGIELALRNCEHRQRDDVSSEAYSQQHRQVETEAELERKTLQRIGGPEARDTTVDKRVPDIPQHSPSYAEHHWRTGGGLETDREPEICHISVKQESSPTSSPHLFIPVQNHSAVEQVSVASPSSTPVFKCECPEASPLPLDFTTHSRRAGSNSPRGASPVQSLQGFADNAAPMDLSLKKPYIPYPRIESELHTPVFVCSSTPLSHHSGVIHSDHPLPNSQIWDLSTKGIKRPHEDDVTGSYSYCSSVSSSTADVKPPTHDTKPVKLFKPYLLDHTDDSSNNSSDNKSVNCTDNCGLVDLGGYSTRVISDSEPYYYNNNNNIEYVYYKDELYPGSIQPNGNFYCPLTADYYTGSNIHLNYVDDVKNTFVLKKNSNLIKQRQSYSLDFKLSAIQCYYSDEVCKGNQRAVATKYKIHRRQVQKWLKQEDQLRQRNETSKHMHIVR